MNVLCSGPGVQVMFTQFAKDEIGSSYKTTDLMHNHIHASNQVNITAASTTHSSFLLMSKLASALCTHASTCR